jgi:hypothetical protein
VTDTNPADNDFKSAPLSVKILRVAAIVVMALLLIWLGLALTSGNLWSRVGRLAQAPGGQGAGLEIPAPPASKLETSREKDGRIFKTYSCNVDINAVVSYYRSEMKRLGWQVLERESGAYSKEYANQSPDQASKVLIFSAQDRSCLIVMTEDANGGGLMVQIMSGQRRKDER